ncbi:MULTISPECIES: DUF2637 domain-containing protein [Streptomyces]|uniref:DUF2637 domain-containing protein n=1 Tax=Streptomyces TaxID=1883 RepID=UPI0033DBE95B
MSTAPAAESAAGAIPAAREATPAGSAPAPAGGGRGRGRLSAQRLFGVVALLGMIPVAGVGFAASYDTLRRAAEARHFSHDLSYWVPVGIDGAILAFLALDLYMSSRRIPWPLLRFAAHLMVLATIVFNAGGAGVGDDVVGVAWHGLMPVLFVIGVEAVRKLLLHATKLANGEVTDRIPLHRWLLAPVPTARLYRRMRLANVRSYPEMVRREQDLEGYQMWLTQELGGDLSKASDVQRLPMTMAPRGFTVEEALALPARWEAEAAERARLESERDALEEAEAAERAADLAIKKAEAAAREETAKRRLEVQTITAATDVDVVAAEAQARAESARVKAERIRTQAEREAAAEIEAAQSAEAAALLRQAAEDKKKAATAAADAEAERSREEAERARAQAERTKAARLKADEEEEKARRAQAEKDAARARADADAERARAMAERARIAALEVEAQLAEDMAGLNQRQRKARRVARMIVLRGGSADNVDVVSLADIEADPFTKASRTTAGELRAEAKQMLAEGYDPMSDYMPPSWQRTDQTEGDQHA